MNGLVVATSTEHHIPQLPDPLKTYLVLLDDPVGLPVCRACQAAVLPKSLLDHLRKNHELPVKLRRDVRSLVAALPSLDFNDVPKKPDGSAPLETLRIVDTFQCKHRPFVRKDLTDMRKHINQEHKISASGCYDHIQAQSWFGGRRVDYWRVCIVPKVRTLWEFPPCIWAFYGKGFGNRRPMAWDSEKVAASLAPDS